MRSVSAMFPWPFRSRTTQPPPPLVHITHAKAGSTWIDKILRQLHGPHVSPRLWQPPERFDFARYRIYPALFITREKYCSYPELLGVHRFVVIRDLRDTLVSHYFSVRDTHKPDPDGIIAKGREILCSLSKEDGLTYLMDEVLSEHAAIQQSWLGAEIVTFRYEDLLSDDLAILRRLFLETFGHQLTESQVDRAVISCRFESLFRRKLGEEDPSSHGRKGAPGDWRNHFTPALARRFHDKFGAVLVGTGYERDDSWTRQLPN
jgi:hypothetical protein